MKIYSLILIFLLFFTDASYAVFKLKNGDIIFQDLDGSPLVEAIEKVTVGFRNCKFAHIGIIYIDKAGKTMVIESIPEAGVCLSQLDSFLKRSSDSSGRPKCAVGRLKKNYSQYISSAISRALSMIGMKYDRAFLINNDSIYCAELIWRCYLYEDDSHIFKLAPMTFKDPDTGSFFKPWLEYYKTLALPIPEGKPGINPGLISTSDVLDIYFPYGLPDGYTLEGN